MKDKRYSVVVEFSKMNNTDLQDLADVLLDAGVIIPVIENGEPAIKYCKVNNLHISRVRHEIEKHTLGSVERVSLIRETKQEPCEWTGRDRWSFDGISLEKRYEPLHTNQGATQRLRYPLY